MNANTRPSQRMAILGAINPAAITAGAPANSGWIRADQFLNYLAIVQAGALGASGTLDAKLQQANTAAGGGAKDVAGKAIVQMVKATDDNKQALINLRGDELDIANGFQWFRLQIAAGTANATAGGLILGVDPGNAPPAPAASVHGVVI